VAPSALCIGAARVSTHRYSPSKRRKRCRRVREEHRCADARRGHADLHRRVEPKRARRGLCPSPEDRASQRQTAEKRADARRHRVDIDADDQRELFDPQELKNQRGGPRKEEDRRAQRTNHARIMA